MIKNLTYAWKQTDLRVHSYLTHLVHFRTELVSPIKPDILCECEYTGADPLFGSGLSPLPNKFWYILLRV